LYLSFAARRQAMFRYKIAFGRHAAEMVEQNFAPLIGHLSACPHSSADRRTSHRQEAARSEFRKRAEAADVGDEAHPGQQV
jgi:hypothetical protein